MRSWEKLIALNCKYYVTAHNGIMEHNDIVNQYNEYNALML